MALSPAEKAIKKEEQRVEAEKNMAEYRASKLAEEKKTERLRALRLAREAKEAEEAATEAAASDLDKPARKKKTPTRQPAKKRQTH